MAKDNLTQRMAEPRERTSMATKIVLMGTMAGPQGVARRGSILDAPGHITDETAKYLLETKQAREYESADVKRPKGFIQAKIEQ